MNLAHSAPLAPLVCRFRSNSLNELLAKNRDKHKHKHNGTNNCDLDICLGLSSASFLDNDCNRNTLNNLNLFGLSFYYD